MVQAAVYDCEGARLSDEERAFFRDADPWGFIVFARHCESVDALKAHCDELRDCVGRDAPILIDQEGGRVVRMKPPLFPKHHAPALFGALWQLDHSKALEAVRLNAYLLSRMVSDLGVTVNCMPSLDLPQIDSDPQTLGDRAFARHQDTIIPLAQAAVEGALAGGACPVVKHLPGLGRALCDSHYELPRVSAGLEDLRRQDFVPFAALNDAPMGMSAHVVYEAIDPDQPATISKTVVGDIIRGEIGFDGLLLTDDLKMQALGGPYGTRAKNALEAGCDVALMCNLSLAEKQEAAGDIPALSAKASERAARAMERVEAADRDEVAERYAALDGLLRPVLV